MEKRCCSDDNRRSTGGSLMQKDDQKSSSRRLFLGQLSPTATSSSISEAISIYGVVECVDIRESTCGKQKRNSDNDGGLGLPYAFVTFEDVEGAQKMLSAHAEKDEGSESRASGSMFRVVEPTRNKQKKTKKKSSEGCNDATCARCEAELKSWTDLLVLKEDCTIIVLQLPTSHYDRTVDYIASTFPESKVKIVATHRRGDETLLFISTGDHLQFLSYLSGASFVRRIVKKAYVLGNSTSERRKTRVVRIRCSAGWQQVVANEVLRLLRLVRRDEEEVAARITSFPPKVASKLSSDPILAEASSDGILLTLNNMTHTISIIQMNGECNVGAAPKRKYSNSTGSGIYLVSVEGVPAHAKGFYWNQIKGDDNAISRAYHKIEEAFDRYFGSNINKERASLQDALTGSVALDCGAAPGGWSQYLSEKVGCSTVYSVDPGELSATALDMEGVRHVQTMIDDALNVLVAEEARIDVWVSDMCLHDMMDQFNWFLAAKERGVLRKGDEEERGWAGCFFVITLKCVRGFSRKSFDAQVREQVLRLDDIARDVEVIHLFANRTSERTVVGLLN